MSQYTSVRGERPVGVERVVVSEKNPELVIVRPAGGSNVGTATIYVDGQTVIKGLPDVDVEAAVAEILASLSEDVSEEA